MPIEHTASPTRLRVFAETVEPRRLRSREVLAALAERGVQLVVAVRPGDDDPRGVIDAARAAGVSIAVWPMLADADGRWASSANASAFAANARAVLDRLADADALPDELCLDLEPPLPLLRRAIDRGTGLGRVGGDRDQAVVELAGLIDHAGHLGLPSWATVVPLVLADAPREPSWQGLLGTPVDALPLGRVCVMLYTSLMIGYARGVLRRRDAEYLLAASSTRAAARFGARASVALGAVGPGALGDEATYRDIDELHVDVALARAAGIADLALFELGGVLARRDWQAWLDALVDPPRALTVVSASRRARLLFWTSGAVSRAVALRRR